MIGKEADLCKITMQYLSRKIKIIRQSMPRRIIEDFKTMYKIEFKTMKLAKFLSDVMIKVIFLKNCLDIFCVFFSQYVTCIRVYARLCLGFFISDTSN